MTDIKPVKYDKSKMPIRVVMLNADTGEVLNEGVPIFKQAKFKNFSQDYMVMFLSTFKNIALDATIKQEELRVLLYIISMTEMKNWVHLQQKDIATALEMKTPNVNRAIKKLIERGLIESTVQTGKSKNYRIPINIGWRGPGKEYAKEKFLSLVK